MVTKKVKVEPSLREALPELFEKGNYGLSFYHFYHMMDKDEALMLDYLVSYAHRVKAHHRGGWFFRTAESIENDINRKRMAQFRVLRRLEQLGLIEIKRKGSPPKRHFRICYDGIKRLMHEKWTV